jgi:hypothetical protein
MIYATVLGQYQPQEIIMKKLLIGLLILGSFSTFAQSNGDRIVHLDPDEVAFIKAELQDAIDYATRKSMTSDDLKTYRCVSALPGMNYSNEKYFKASGVGVATSIATMEYNRERNAHSLSLVVKCNQV